MNIFEELIYLERKCSHIRKSNDEVDISITLNEINRKLNSLSVEGVDIFSGGGDIQDMVNVAHNELRSHVLHFYNTLDRGINELNSTIIKHNAYKDKWEDGYNEAIRILEDEPITFNKDKEREIGRRDPNPTRKRWQNIKVKVRHGSDISMVKDNELLSGEKNIPSLITNEVKYYFSLDKEIEILNVNIGKIYDLVYRLNKHITNKENDKILYIRNPSNKHKLGNNNERVLKERDSTGITKPIITNKNINSNDDMFNLVFDVNLTKMGYTKTKNSVKVHEGGIIKNKDHRPDRLLMKLDKLTDMVDASFPNDVRLHVSALRDDINNSLLSVCSDIESVSKRLSHSFNTIMSYEQQIIKYTVLNLPR